MSMDESVDNHENSEGIRPFDISINISEKSVDDIRLCVFMVVTIK